MRSLSLRQFINFASASMLALAAPAWAEKYTVAVIPDPQYYNSVTLPQPRGIDTFIQQVQYVVDKLEEMNLAFVTFVGDIVDHGDGNFREKIKDSTEYRLWDTRGEWDNATRAISILSRSGAPFGMSPGNHDYDSAYWWEEPDSPGANRPFRGGRTWNYYFGPQSRHFADKPWYGGSFNQGLNSYQFFTGGGKRFLHISFEMEPSQAALDWAQGVIDANPDLPVIMSTHGWLAPGQTERTNNHKDYFEGSDHLPPDEIWNRFVRKNQAIFLILCGHAVTPPVNGVSRGENLRIDRNDAGFPVYQVLTDYQGYSIGPDGKNSATPGAGWLRFIEFDTDKRKMHFYTYSTLLGRYAGRNGYLPFGTPAHLSDFELDFPPQLLK